jgi:signal transduction histidine kinase
LCKEWKDYVRDLPIGVIIIDIDQDLKILEWNKIVNNFLPEHDPAVLPESVIKETMRSIRVKTISCDTTNNQIPEGVPLLEFVSKYRNSTETLRSFFELTGNRLIELRVTKVIRGGKELPLLTFIDCNLVQRLEKLKAESQSKTLTMSVISHELRAPVNAILGSIESIKKHVPAEEQLHIDLVRNSCYMLSYQINDLTDYGKMSDSKLVLDKTRIDLDEIVDECISIVNLQAKGKKLTVEHIKTKDTPKTIWANQRRIKQVLLNLLMNAIKFTQKGKVEVISRTTNTEVLISVKDTGLGIKKDELPKLFTEFGMLDEHRAINANGTGLGLFISRKLIHEMEGEITVTSKYLQGSEFIIHLPLEPSNNAVPASGRETTVNMQESELNDSQCDCNKILLVDDTEINIFVISELLKQVGLNCDVARNGEEAIESVRKRRQNECCVRYRLIFMDFNMPGISGPEATREIKKIARESFVVGLTGDNIEDVTERKDFEMIECKPLSMSKLKEILRKYKLLQDN